jgi:hypothetical protein
MEIRIFNSFPFPFSLSPSAFNLLPSTFPPFPFPFYLITGKLGVAGKAFDGGLVLSEVG